jgi:putative transposase
MSIEKALQFVKGGFSLRAKKELGYNGEIWQRGFSESRVTSAEQYLGIRNYIRNNPITRRVAFEPQQYPLQFGHWPV